MSRDFLVLGGRTPGAAPNVFGWHQRQLIEAARQLNVNLWFADYESLSAQIGIDRVTTVEAQNATDNLHSMDASTQCKLRDFSGVLTRTMPAGSMERITFRLATLHEEFASQKTNAKSTIINPPRSLELAIDKYATLALASSLAIPVPDTIVTQNRAVAMEAFDRLGGDVVVKPIFGGEGRGVMRVQERELAWTVFSTLEQISAVFYVQKFVPPGGIDLRLLFIGDHIHAIRRFGESDFRTNVRGGGRCELVEIDPIRASWARKICEAMELTIAAIDFLEIESDDLGVLVEVNAIPGWRGAQSVVQENIARQIVSQLIEVAT